MGESVGAQTTTRYTLALGLGYGLHVAWISSLFFQSDFFALAGDSGLGRPFYLLSMVALVLSLLLIARLSARARLLPVLHGHPVIIAAAAIIATGTLLVYPMAHMTGRWESFALFGCAVLTGIGSSLLTVLWGRLLVVFRDVHAALPLCIAYAVGAVVDFVLYLLPTPLPLILTATLPAASVAMAFYLEKRQGQEAAPPATLDEHTAADAHSFSNKLIIVAFIFGFVQGLIQLINSFFDDNIGIGISLVLYLGAPLVLIYAYLSHNSKRSTMLSRFVVVYRLALLIMIAALLINGAVEVAGYPIHAIMLLGYTFFKIVVWAEFCQIGRTGSAAPERLFGYGEAAMTLGVLLGNSLLSPLPAFTEGGAEATRIASALCVALLLVAYLFFFTEHQVIAIEEMGKTEDGPLHPRFQDRMDALADSFGLTKREAEVAVLFVRGRSTPRIAEDLYISSGTVSTHLRNVYRKTGVHSRQELLDLLDKAADS